MITENNKILFDLQRVLTYRFVFFLPYDILEIENVRGILSFMGIELTQEFIDECVDVLLVFDFDLEIHHLEKAPYLIEANNEKALHLQGNCSRLAGLKDTLGKTSFRHIFNKYVEQIVALNFVCDKLVEFYYNYFPDEKDITYIFRQQKLVLLTHLFDIEKTFLKKGKPFDTDEILEDLLKAVLALPPVRETNKSNEVTNEQADDIQANHSKDVKLESEAENSFPDITVKDGKKYLRDFIIKGDEVELEKMLNKRFKDSMPKRIRLLIECLAEMHYLTLAHGDLKRIVAGMNNSFENESIINYDSVKGIIVDKVTNKDYKNLKLEVAECISLSEKISQKKRHIDTA